MTNFIDVCGNAIDVGSHVRLTGTGTLPLTVIELGQDNSNGSYYVKCAWFDADTNHCVENFPVQCVQLMSTRVEVAEDCENNQ